MANMAAKMIAAIANRFMLEEMLYSNGFHLQDLVAQRFK